MAKPHSSHNVLPSEPQATAQPGSANPFRRREKRQLDYVLNGTPKTISGEQYELLIKVWVAHAEEINYINVDTAVKLLDLLELPNEELADLWDTASAASIVSANGILFPPRENFLWKAEFIVLLAEIWHKRSLTVDLLSSKLLPSHSATSLTTPVKKNPFAQRMLSYDTAQEPRKNNETGREMTAISKTEASDLNPQPNPDLEFPIVSNGIHPQVTQTKSRFASYRAPKGSTSAATQADASDAILLNPPPSNFADGYNESRNIGGKRIQTSKDETCAETSLRGSPITESGALPSRPGNHIVPEIGVFPVNTLPKHSDLEAVKGYTKVRSVTRANEMGMVPVWTDPPDNAGMILVEAHGESGNIQAYSGVPDLNPSGAVNLSEASQRPPLAGSQGHSLNTPQSSPSTTASHPLKKSRNSGGTESLGALDTSSSLPGSHELYAPHASEESRQAALELLRFLKADNDNGTKNGKTLRKVLAVSRLSSFRSGFDRHILAKALVQAAKEGSLPVIESLLSLGADINHCPAQRPGPLRSLPTAAKYGHGHAVEYLISRGSNLENINIAFVTACYRGFVGLTERLLLAHGANLYYVVSPPEKDGEIKDTGHDSKLMPSKGSGFDAVSKLGDEVKRLRFLTLFISRPEFQANKIVQGGDTALSLFVTRCCLPSVRLLLKAGANATPITEGRAVARSPIDCLRWSKDAVATQAILELLLQHGARTSTSTALASAVDAGSLEGVQLLLAKFAMDPYAKTFNTEFSWIPIFWNAIYSGRLDIVRVLVTAGAETWRPIEPKAHWNDAQTGKAPIYWAARFGHDRLVEYFIEHNPELADSCCLSVAVSKSHLAVVRRFLGLGVDIADDIWVTVMKNKPDIKTRDDYLKIVDLLLLKESSFDSAAVEEAINVGNYVGFERLMTKRSQELKELLNKKEILGDHPHRRTTRWRTWLSYAEWRDRSTFVTLLEKHGGVRGVDSVCLTETKRIKIGGRIA